MSKIGVIDILQNAVERVTQSFASISTEHKYIHEGRLFTVPVIQEIADGASYKITFTTPDADSNLFMHYRPAAVVTSADNVTVGLYEGSTGITGGTPHTVTNRRRIAPKVSETSVLLGTAVTGDGTLIDQTYIGGSVGAGQARGGGELGEENEFVLKVDTPHTLVISNGSSTPQKVYVMLKWYEEDGY